MHRAKQLQWTGGKNYEDGKTNYKDSARQYSFKFPIRSLWGANSKVKLIS